MRYSVCRRAGTEYGFVCGLRRANVVLHGGTVRALVRCGWHWFGGEKSVGPAVRLCMASVIKAGVVACVDAGDTSLRADRGAPV